MKVTTDEEGRMVCEELFPPRSTFDSRRMPDGTVRVVKLENGDVPVVKSVLAKDGLMVSPVRVSRETIRPPSVQTVLELPHCNRKTKG
ncbi:MAG: hypothetical protein HY298_03625 [Verrucomicrobia bacterium]|nr:hypothetical protein [Verrucomicrobiota bacterium]